jgi:hypothetical protein
VSVPIKFLISCNLRPGREKAKTALEYLTQDFTECLHEAGIHRVEVWFTVYGTWPHIRMIFLCEEPAALRSFLKSNEWKSVKNEVEQNTEALRYKVVVWKDHFQF